jgi:hypothetical protein
MSAEIYEPQCEIEGASVVLLGSFNPRIFHPLWLQKQGLATESEANDLVQVPGHTMFTIEGLRYTVQPERFQIEADDPESVPGVGALVVAIFDILPHTPISQLGINRHMHFRVQNDAVWHKVGHKLAPKELWREIMESPGTRSLTVEGRRKGASEGVLRMTVEPSIKLHPAVYVGTNEHYEQKTGDLKEILRHNYQAAQTGARQAALHLVRRLVEIDTDQT